MEYSKIIIPERQQNLIKLFFFKFLPEPEQMELLKSESMNPVIVTNKSMIASLGADWPGYLRRDNVMIFLDNLSSVFKSID